MSKSAISDEMRVDMVKLFYANGSSWTAARRALTKKYGNDGRQFIKEQYSDRCEI